METLKNTYGKISKKLDKFSLKKSVASALKWETSISMGTDLIRMEKEDDQKQYIMKREIAAVKLHEFYGNSINHLFNKYNVNYHQIRDIAQRLRRIKGQMPNCDEIENEILPYLAIEKLFRIFFRKIDKLDNKLEGTRSELYNTVNDAYKEVEKIYSGCYSNLSDYYKSIFGDLSKIGIIEMKDIKRTLVMVYILKRDELLNYESWKDTCNYMMNQIIAAAYNGAFSYSFSYVEMLSNFGIPKEESQKFLKYIDLS